jgi:hypothetical protein
LLHERDHQLSQVPKLRAKSVDEFRLADRLPEDLVAACHQKRCVEASETMDLGLIHMWGFP